MSADIMPTKTFQGYWWIPSKPDTKLCGELIYKENENLRLTLLGIFSNNLPSFTIIHGSTGEGIRLTLYDCHTIEASQTTLGHDYVKEGQLFHGKSTILCSILFEGVHINKKEEMIFDRLYLNFENQELWLGEKIIDIQHKHKDKKHIVAYTAPDEKEYRLSNFIFKIYYRFGGHYSARWVDNKISYTSYIDIELDEPQEFDEIWRIFNNTKNFISLFSGQVANINSMSVNYKELEENIDVNILFNKRKASPDNNHKIYPYKMITTFNQLPNPKNLLNNWFDNADFFSLLFGLYFSSKDNPHRYITDYFLSLTQAIDTYHIRKNEREYIEINEFNKLKEKFLEVIKNLPKNEREHFVTKVKYMNNKSLRLKLREIGKSFDYLKGILNIFDEDSIAKIVDTRNYYTHYDPEDELKAIPISELYNYIKELRFLILAIILSELGLPEEEIIKYINNALMWHIL